MKKKKKNKQRKTYTLNLTKLELMHLRDLFSIVLPTEMKDTVSQRLALSQDRTLVEAKLWQTITASCREAKVDLDDGAPDFVIAISSTPAMGVYELAHEPSGPAPQQEQKNVLDDIAEGEKKEDDAGE